MDERAITALKQKLMNIALDIGTLPNPEFDNLVEFTTTAKPVIQDVQACAKALVPNFPIVARTLDAVATTLTDLGEAIQTDQAISPQANRIAFRQSQISAAQTTVNEAIESIR